MKQKVILPFIAIILISCQSKRKTWSFDAEIPLGKAAPIGIAKTTQGYWLADGDNNRIILLNQQLDSIDVLEGFDRPMHLSTYNKTLYIPEYGADKISVINAGDRDTLAIPLGLDAPAGIDAIGKEIAIADFYNHRILFFNGNQWTIIGKQGHELGGLYYPTDVQIIRNKIVVADAYNNRVQLFSKSGEALKQIGKAQNINAATGIFCTQQEIYVTDFENNRVLAFDYEGNVLQELKEGLEKPTDIYVEKDLLLITNYKSKSIASYR